jgi:N-methylhydantoinase A
MKPDTIRLAVDAGGTFTDICAVDEGAGSVFVWKVSSTPDDPSVAISEGAREALQRFPVGGKADVSYFGHGTTVATNALIQKLGARTALVTTRGFRDLLEIGRQRRPSLYDLQCEKPVPLVPRDLRFQVSERIHFDGRVEQEIDEEEMREVARCLREARVDAIAICFLYSFVDPRHEQIARRIVAEECPDAFISCSHEICPEFREYERLSTTVVNAYLGPMMKSYLSRLAPRLRKIGISTPPHLTQSNGGTITFETAGERASRTVLSGPSTGVIGATRLAGMIGHDDIITFDMGGTSTDVSLITNGKPPMTNEAEVHGYPLKVPMIDINVVGAGGGSIATIDSGNLLKVGPRSAGAVPGPVCYDLGSEEPTVTDANVVLGVLNPSELLGGRMKIDRDLAFAAMERLAKRLDLSVMETAQGIISVVTSNMARAIRVVSVQRGYDPRDYTLVAFGGAGPIHAGRLVMELEIPRIIVPLNPGILCALGLLLTDLRSDLSITRRLRLEEDALDQIDDALAHLRAQASEWFDREGIDDRQQRLTASIDMRYSGQNYELNIPFAYDTGEENRLENLGADFEEAHKRMYGYTAPEEPIEIVTFRLEAYGIVGKPRFAKLPDAGPDTGHAEIGSREVYFSETGGFGTSKVYDRLLLMPGNRLEGPAIVEQMDSTTLILPGQVGRVDEYLNLIIEGEPA